MKKISVAPENPQYRIVEIFESLQGEGWNTGMPAVFVRLGKCNLACGWCDTDYLKFGMMSLSDILGRLKTYAARNIIITGGEPTIQPHLDTLLDALKAEGYFLCIETNGLKPAPPQIDYVATSPKACYAAAVSPKPTKCALWRTAMSLRSVKTWNVKSVRAITTFRPANKTV
jgi:radical SAM domain protein